MSDPKSTAEINDLLGRLQQARAEIVERSRSDLLAHPEQADLINRYIDELEELVLSGLAPQPGEPRSDRGVGAMVGLGDRVAVNVGDVQQQGLVPAYDNQINRERLIAVGDLYYIYQHERAGIFRAILKLQELFRSGEVRLSDGRGAIGLYQYDRKRVLRYTNRERRAFYRKVFGYTEAQPPIGAEPNAAFHALLSNFCQHVSRYFEDKRVSEVLRPDGRRETFGSMAVVRRSGLDLRANLKQVSYGNIAVLRSELSVLLQDAFDILGAEDVLNLFGADNAWDALEEVLMRYMHELPLSSQRSRMATAGRAILRWLSEPYLLSQVRSDFDAFLADIVDPCEDWLTSAESVGIRKLSPRRDDNVVVLRPAARIS